MNRQRILFSLLGSLCAALAWCAPNPSAEELADSLMRHVILLAPRYQQAVERYEAETYVKGYLHVPRSNKTLGCMHWFTPVDKYPKDKLFELDAQVCYEAPNHYLNRIRAFQASQLSTSDHLQELFAFINFNIYAPTIYDKEVITPLAPEATSYYNFSLEGSSEADGQTLHHIRFTPRKWSQKLLAGELFIVDSLWTIDRIIMSGRSSLEEFTIDMRFSRLKNDLLLPVQADFQMRFDAFGNQIITELHAAMRYTHIMRQLPQPDQPASNPLDETRYYTVTSDSLRYEPNPAYWAALRDKPLTPTEQALYDQPLPDSAPADSSLLDQYAHLGTQLTSTVNRNYKTIRMKYSGLLNPLQLSYDSEDGLAYKQELRLSHTYTHDRQLRFHPEVGYLFKKKQLRVKITTDWEYLPERMGQLSLILANDNQTFSSDHMARIDELLKQQADQKGFKFESLGLDYYRHYYAKLSNQIELLNGLTLQAGLDYHLRTPVQTASAAPKLKNANDFEPFIGLRFTPQQHYWMDGFRKEYLNASFPTLRVELGKGISGVIGSSSNYWRLEGGLNQTLRLGLSERLSYNFSTGSYLHTRQTYFANFRYFAKNYFPEPWRDRFGGNFHLLNDDWYFASSHYAQAHLMYEAPFILLRFMKPRAHRYILSERFYLSQLWAPAKPNHTEMGYGVGNDLLNIALFFGFDKFNYQSFGLKLSLELFR